MADITITVFELGKHPNHCPKTKDGQFESDCSDLGCIYSKENLCDYPYKRGVNGNRKNDAGLSYS